MDIPGQATGAKAVHHQKIPPFARIAKALVLRPIG